MNQKIPSYRVSAYRIFPKKGGFDRYKTLGLCLLFLALFCPPSQAAFVTGTIKNGSPGATVELTVPQFYLDGHLARYRTVLDGQLQFSIQAEILEPGLAFLGFNDDRLPIFLAKDDTLSIKTDVFQFPVSVSFSGKSAADNRLLKEYLKQNQLDFNEFNNIRFKIGQTWVIVEEPMNSSMESLTPDLFKSTMDAQKETSISLVDGFVNENPGALSPAFREWLHTETTYNWAYHLLVYGHVYAGRYGIQPDFFYFLYDAPIISDQVGSDWYRQFIVAFLARQQAKISATENFWSGQYALAEKLLSGKSLAFFRSELIATAFSTERFTEILPLYADFLQHNPHTIFDDKVEGLYQKYARVSPGAAAPAFEGVERGGNTISLAQFHGKVVYLNFWASWCGACLRKMDFFDEFAAELNARGIEIVNISVDEKASNWEKSLDIHTYKGHHLLASSGLGRNIAAAYGVEAVPQYFIIGRNGLFEIKAPSSQPNDVRQKLLDISRKGQ